MAFETFKRKATKDGYINKDEARKAQEKNINLQGLQDYYGKKPLKVRGSAQKIFDAMNAAAAATAATATEEAQPVVNPLQSTIDDMQVTIDNLTTAMNDRETAYNDQLTTRTNELTTEFDSRISDFEKQLKDERNTFDTKLGGLTTQLADRNTQFNQTLIEQQKKYENMQTTLRGQLNPATRNPVMGVRLAGNNNVNSKGIKSTFGRKGSRIQGIRNTSLNVT